MSRERWILDMVATPVVPPMHTESPCQYNGAELQHAILHGFSEYSHRASAEGGQEFNFEKTFTFKEHGEFFRGALTMASVRYAGDFYELLKRYETINVKITKEKRVEE